MHYYFQQIRDRRRAEGKQPGLMDSGFTLIELLIVIVVLGILAAIVIFSLTGVTGQSEAAACNSDAKTYETAVAAYEAENPTAGNPTITDLTATGGNGPYLHSPSSATLGSNGYAVQLGSSGNVQVETSKQATPTWTDYDTGGQTLCNNLG